MLWRFPTESVGVAVALVVIVELSEIYCREFMVALVF